MKPLNLFLPFLSLIFLYACSLSRNIYDEEIYDKIKAIQNTEEKKLISYISKNGYKIKYNPNRNQKCIKLDHNHKEILVPSYLDSEILKETKIVKALYTAMIIDRFELSEMLYEAELISSYKEIEYILKNFSPDEIKKDELLKKEMMSKICMYILSDEIFDKKIMEETEKKDKLCRYPLNKLNDREEYYSSLKKALKDIKGDAYFNIVYNELAKKVKRGEITENEMQSIYVRLISLPTDELYRMQRKEVNSNIRSIKRFKRFYDKEIKRF